MNNKLIDMIGKRFGLLTVVSRSENRKSPSGNIITRWHCVCDCGKELDVDAYALRCGNTKSCGCEAHGKGFKDITGKRFTRLTVEGLYEKKNKKTYWKCKCDCGNEIIVSKSNLLNGNTKSCGCLRSTAESFIQKWLKDNRIKYKSDYTYKDLIGPGGGRLIFDFAILNSENNVEYLIEYQGAQHYIDSLYFGKQQREITDQQKKDYCQQNNIILHEIRYDEDLEIALSTIILSRANPVPSEHSSKV